MKPVVMAVANLIVARNSLEDAIKYLNRAGMTDARKTVAETCEQVEKVIAYVKGGEQNG